MHAGKIRKLFLSVSATTTAVSFASILLLLLLLRRDMHFCILVEVLLLLIIILLGCAAADAGACAANNISTESERDTGYCFFLLRFCPLHCDIPVMVVDCAALETGCIPEKYVNFFSPSPLLLLLFPLRLFYCCCCC